MALTGARVLVLALLAAALIAIALLPPSPDWWEDQHRRWVDTPTRVALLDRATRRAETRLRLLAMRDSAAPVLARRPPHAAMPTLVVTDALSPLHRRPLEAAWDSVTAKLGPAAGTGVGMRVLASDAGEATLYLLPEATGGGCVVVVDLGRWLRSAQMPRVLRRALGPCAYYHAFGPPGPHVRAWLERTGFQTAQEADWEDTDRAVAARRRGDPLVPEGRDFQRVMAAVWERPYLETLEQTGCAAGRLAKCLRALDTPEGWFARQRRWPRLEAAGGFVRPGPLAPWWASEPGYFLADLVRDQGRERFARFWQSPLPVDSAFAATFGMPLELERRSDRWTARLKVAEGTSQAPPSS